MRTLGGSQTTKVLVGRASVLSEMGSHCRTVITVECPGVTVADVLRIDCGGQGLKQGALF